MKVLPEKQVDMRLLVIAFLLPAAACVQLTDFDDFTAGSDGSSSGAGGSESTVAADDGSTGPEETSEGEPGPGDSSWLRLTERGSAYYGVHQTSDGQVHAVGEKPVDGDGGGPGPRGLARHYSANGEAVAELDAAYLSFDPVYFTDACEGSNGAPTVFGSITVFTNGVSREIIAPFVLLFDPSGGLMNLSLISGHGDRDFPVTSATTPRMVCDGGSLAWVAVDHTNNETRSILLKRIDWLNDSPNNDMTIDMIEVDDDHEILGLGRDGDGKIHLAIRTGAEPASGDPLVRWLSYQDADDVEPDQLELDAAVLPGTQPVSFAIRGGRAVITTLDPELDTTWVVAYDSNGDEQWRTSAIPSPAEGWAPGRVGLGEDGSVVMMAAVGTHPEQHLGLLELDDDGALAWSAEYPFAMDGEPQLDHIQLGDLDVGPEAIDVVGSATIDGEDQVGWARRVLR
jgi:hypothetical protein